ncbi:MAG: TolC family protein [Rhodobacteraceae bacterium]|nr:TolC family protein [Paracoccaceae bacterium]
MKRFVAGLAALVGIAPSAQALDFRDTILFVLETHPEISAAAANKQALEFELDQSRSFFAPRFEFEAFGGSSYNDGTTTNDLTSSDDPITGYEISARMRQLLWDGWETRSEVNRQAYRVDAAALRVLERSEVLSLEAIRIYSDVRRTEQLLALARQNLSYHEEVVRRVNDGARREVLLQSDLRQAEERLALAQDTVVEFEFNRQAVRNEFLQIVGVDAGPVTAVPSIASAMPASLDAALATARRSNPTIRFLQADVGAAEQLAARTDANQFPKLFLEADGRIGQDVGGFVGARRDARVGLVLRYEIQGTSKRSARQEQSRRVNESRSNLLHQTRIVEREVRQSWAALEAAKRRFRIITQQAELALEVRQAYEQEILVGARSLLDILNTQNAYFQAQANQINAAAVEVFAEYRVLAAAGILLPSLGLQPPEDALVYAREQMGVPGRNRDGDEAQIDAGSFRDWRRSIGTTGD